MKRFDDFIFDLDQFKSELAEFNNLLNNKAELSERKDVLPFFTNRRQLAFQIPVVADSNFVKPTKIAFEYDLFGDFCADLVVGQINKEDYRFYFIEFEDALKGSIFKTSNAKYKPEFAPRFEHGYSQIIDWFYKMDGLQNSNDFEERFGKNKITYEGILIIGMDRYLDPSMKNRLAWRNEKVIADSKHVRCFTFDELYDILSRKIELSEVKDKIFI